MMEPVTVKDPDPPPQTEDSCLNVVRPIRSGLRGFRGGVKEPESVDTHQVKMQHKSNAGSHQEPDPELRDQHEQQLQDERKSTQKKTFTRWMNVFLQRRDPPLEVHDLFDDVQDGRVLMVLLEELSGCQLLYRFRSSSHRIFRLNNVSKALAFLDDRHVKLLGIDASGVADGVPSVVLNLVWNIILHFQVKEVTRGLQRHLSSSLSSLSMSSYPSSDDLSPQINDTGSYSCSTLPSKSRKAAREPKYHGKAIKTLLHWVQRCTSKFGVEVRDFGRSWRSGLAFLALIKSINPDLVDMRESLSKEARENVQQAFTMAHQSLGVAPLLEPEDVICASPDEKSIITYVSMFLRRTDQDHITDFKVPEIPNFGSLESISFGEIHADDTEAQTLLRGLEKSSEQLLWKRWSRRRSSESQHSTWIHTSGAVTPGLSSSDSDIFTSSRSSSVSDQPGTSTFNVKKSRSRSILQPPSPLDAGVVSQEIRSWLEKSSDQVSNKPRRDEGHFSLSSEEGVYTLSALDSDEEDAYSYILDLNKDAFQPFNQLKRKVPKVEEETAEEINEEAKHGEVCEMINGSGSESQEGSRVQNAKFGVRVQLSVHRKFDLDKNESSLRKMINIEPEDERRRGEETQEVRDVRGQINDDGGDEKDKTDTENGFHKSEAVIFKVTRQQQREDEDEDEDDSDREISGESVRDQQSVGVHTEEENDTVKKHRGEDEEEEEETMKKRRRKINTKKNENDPEHKPTSGCSSGRGRFLASCDITPLELETLVFMWIFVYCCFLVSSYLR